METRGSMHCSGMGRATQDWRSVSGDSSSCHSSNRRRWINRPYPDTNQGTKNPLSSSASPSWKDGTAWLDQRSADGIQPMMLCGLLLELRWDTGWTRCLRPLVFHIDQANGPNRFHWPRWELEGQRGWSELVKRRGRWASHRVMEIYFQEVSAATYMNDLDDQVRIKILGAMELFPQVLQQAQRFEHFCFPSPTWPWFFQRGTVRQNHVGEMGANFNGWCAKPTYAPDKRKGEKRARVVHLDL